MASYQEKITRHTKRQKTQFEETEQASELDMAGMLEIPDWNVKQLSLISKHSDG